LYVLQQGLVVGCSSIRWAVVGMEKGILEILLGIFQVFHCDVVAKPNRRIDSSLIPAPN
jgi:hypothetical protein